MDLSAIDPRLVDAAVGAEDVVWKNALEEPFSLHGVYYDEGFGAYRRMPKEIAVTVNPGVAGLSSNTSGGRLRFRTDSPYVAIRAILPTPPLMNHMPLSGSAGFFLGPVAFFGFGSGKSGYSGKSSAVGAFLFGFGFFGFSFISG